MTELAASTQDAGRPTQRSQAKADRRAALLGAAATLFSERGFNGVSIEDLGSAAGVSGPAVYRHFSSKQAVLAALLVGVSERLLEGGTRVEDAADDPASALRALIVFHVDFAVSEPDTIRVQDRDLDALPGDERRAVRRLQRQYIDLWMRVLGRLHPSLSPDELRMRVQAAFGLINSTPHTARVGGASVDAATVRPVLERMAWAGLNAH
ncbi:TetR family transcriptional regulator [Leifsonia sp. Root227]|jgi:AcrR family transcriptional regulator|uniref:SACE_7040 family transcriptional regulator n=1 Tax=unclassified Leifsonia TaxID=2663824 RepID=UPI0006F974B3|nr:TetR/AcrR family transcriptional regulator [Leifsonia sp. Root227]KRC49719.1 TetR family transcriptional regulator [Leifsonia sp. Root227]